MKQLLRHKDGGPGAAATGLPFVIATMFIDMGICCYTDVSNPTIFPLYGRDIFSVPAGLPHAGTLDFSVIPRRLSGIIYADFADVL